MLPFLILIHRYHYLYIKLITQINLFDLQNGNSDDPNCDGIEGVLEAYKQSIGSIQLYGNIFSH